MPARAPCTRGHEAMELGAQTGLLPCPQPQTWTTWQVPRAGWAAAEALPDGVRVGRPQPAAPGTPGTPSSASSVLTAVPGKGSGLREFTPILTEGNTEDLGK